MYLCDSCGKAVADGTVVHTKDSHGFNDGYYETVLSCPWCHSTEIYKAKYCFTCHRAFYGKYAETAEGDIFCERCFEIKDTDED